MVRGLERTLGGVENLRHLGVGGLVVVTHGEHRALLRRQLGDLLLQELLNLSRRDSVHVGLAGEHEVRVGIIIKVQQPLLLLDIGK